MEEAILVVVGKVVVNGVRDGLDLRGFMRV